MQKSETGTAHDRRRASAPQILVCPNAYKGSLSAVNAAEAMRQGILRALPEAQVDCLPMADGGDGLLDTLVAATAGRMFEAMVTGPLGTPVTARWGCLGGEQRHVAVVEMAEASGLRLVRPGETNPMIATTYGTGELMRLAAESGCKTLLVGIGGSATNDGGAGMAQALGARLRDSQGCDLEPGGAALERLASVERSDWLLPDTVQVLVACDVDNPLCGPEGASAIYGPQKGADPSQVARLDAALAHYAEVLADALGQQVREVPGAGAAGGLGAGLLAFCRATLRPGTDIVFEATDFERRLAKADWVLTGEGKLDAQTARGKGIAAVARRAQAAGKPVVALAGTVEKEAVTELRKQGLTTAFSIVNGPLTLEQAMHDTYDLLVDSVYRVALLRDWLSG